MLSNPYFNLYYNVVIKRPNKLYLTSFISLIEEPAKNTSF